MEVKIDLPAPQLKGIISIEEAILKRRSIREYSSSFLTIEEIGQLLWSAQGITDNTNNLRSSPSAGATYPLEIYFVSIRVENLTQGVYRYLPPKHSLVLVKEGNIVKELYYACFEQDCILRSAGIIVISANMMRTTGRYGKRGERYVYIEVGHSSQNVYLQSVSLGIGTVAVGAFEDMKVKEILNLPLGEDPIYLLPVGRV